MKLPRRKLMAPLVEVCFLRGGRETTMETIGFISNNKYRIQ
jgi:hypothetical protein